jgi:RimJ/RimL family protein N-acetyltransferase
MGAVPTESHATIAGEVVTIRPIRITDADMEAAFIRRLSPQTKHYRFLGGVKELAPGEVSRLCDVDGKHSMAFVATIRHDGRETEIGVSRYAPNSRSDVREIAVTVADAWQHKGLGTMLMKQLLESARSNGVKHLYSIALSDNAAMRALAKDLGMTAKRDPSDSQQTVYSLAL